MHVIKFRVSGCAFCKRNGSRNEFSARFQLPPRSRQWRRGRGTEGGCGASQSVSGVAPSRAFPAKYLAGRRGSFAATAKSGAGPVVEFVEFADHAVSKAARLASRAAYKLARWGGIANEDMAGGAGVAGIVGKRNGSLGIRAGRSGAGNGSRAGGAGKGESSRAGSGIVGTAARAGNAAGGCISAFRSRMVISAPWMSFNSAAAKSVGVEP